MYVFGGLLSHKGCKTNELFVTNLDRMVWMKKDPGGERPVERTGTALCLTQTARSSWFLEAGTPRRRGSTTFSSTTQRRTGGPDCLQTVSNLRLGERLDGPAR